MVVLSSLQSPLSTGKQVIFVFTGYSNLGKSHIFLIPKPNVIVLESVVTLMFKICK